MDRRNFLKTIGAAVGTAAVGSQLASCGKSGDSDLDNFNNDNYENQQEPPTGKMTYRTTPLTPPGSLSAQNLAKHCTACQLCISECPNNVLRPSTSLDNFMQPVMSYDRGYCRLECTRCSDVCPTSAIRSIEKEERTAIQVGHAVLIKKNCLAASGEASCGNCARHCPVQAIEMVAVNPDDPESPKIPAIDENKCIGCGACENLCPVRPFSAIYIEGHEKHKEV